MKRTEVETSYVSLLIHCAIKGFRKNHFHKNDSFMVSRVARSISRKYGKAVKKAKTLNSETVKKLVLNLLESGSLVDERSAVFFLIAFLIFGRFEEISFILS